MANNSTFDIIIAGGGAVGCSAALGLSSLLGLKIGVVEAFNKPDSLGDATPHPSFDARVVAIAREPFRQLAEFSIDTHRLNACPIKQIFVSDKGHLGKVNLTINHNEEAFGHVVALEKLGSVLHQQIQKASDIEIINPAKVTNVESKPDNIRLEIQRTDTQESIEVSAKLLLVAEGAQSTTKPMLNFVNESIAYDQTAIITNVETQLPHQYRAFERFTSEGPFALLPMKSEKNNIMSLVWTIKDKNVGKVLNMGKNQFLSEIQRIFGDKLGKFTDHSDVVHYPLNLIKTSHYVTHRAVCLGNAAQSLHPIAGQGFNLAIRDISDLVVSIRESSSDLGSFSQLQLYKKKRNQDKQALMTATDTLVRIFSNEFLPFVIGRNAGLMGLDKLSSLKSKFSDFAMGVR